MPTPVNTPVGIRLREAPAGMVAAGTLRLRILNLIDSSTALAETAVGIEEFAPGEYVYVWTPTQAGTYTPVWRRTTDDEEVSADDVEVVAGVAPLVGVPPAGATDLRWLIPRVRRAVEGPVTAELGDDQVLALAADALAAMIFYSHGAFPYELVVTERNATTHTPQEWAIDPEMPEVDQTAVAAQAALDYYMHELAGVKTLETIRDEGQEWTVGTSAQAVAAKLEELRTARDRALNVIAGARPVADAYVSFLAERDALTASLVEPWLSGQAMLR